MRITTPHHWSPEKIASTLDRLERLAHPGIGPRGLRDLAGVSLGVVEALTRDLEGRGRVRGVRGGGETTYWPVERV